jgi:hypothetical protein
MNIRFEDATIGILLKGPQENTEELILTKQKLLMRDSSHCI